MEAKQKIVLFIGCESSRYCVNSLLEVGDQIMHIPALTAAYVSICHESFTLY